VISPAEKEAGFRSVFRPSSGGGLPAAQTVDDQVEHSAETVSQGRPGRILIIVGRPSHDGPEIDVKEHATGAVHIDTRTQLPA
jgi:hypothetical protein